MKSLVDLYLNALTRSLICKISLTLFFAFSLGVSSAATYLSVTTGNWSSASTWAYLSTGTITCATGSAAVTGSGTSFTTQLTVGNKIYNLSGTLIGTISVITDNTHLTLSANALVAVGGLGYYGTASSAPSSSDDVTITNNFSVTLDATSSCNSLAVTGSPTTNGTSLLSIGAFTLNVTGNTSINGGGSNNKNASIVITSASAVVTIGGNLTVGNGSGTTLFDLSNGSNFSSTLNIAGSMTRNAGGTFTPGTSSTVNFNGSSAQTINFSSFSYANISINNTNASGVTLGAAETAANVTGNISVGNINSGSLFATGNFAMAMAASKTLTIATGSSMNAGSTSITMGTSAVVTIIGTFKTTLAAGFAGTTSTAIKSTNSPTISLGGNSTIEYSGVGQTITVTLPYSNLTLSGSGAKSITTTSITVNGVMSMEGTATFTQTSGSLTFGSSATLQYKGTSGQTTGAEFVSPFTASGGVIINNSNGVTLGASKTISSGLTLTSGSLNLSTFDLNLDATATITGGSSTTLIVTNGTGLVKKTLTSLGSFTYPVGSGIAAYSPITVNTTSGSFTTSYVVTISVNNSKHANNYSTTDYLNRYWTVLQTGISGCVATITSTYLNADVAGSAANIHSAQLNGTYSNPASWTQYSLVSSNTLSASNATLTSGTNSIFTGIGDCSPLTAGFTATGATTITGDMALITVSAPSTFTSGTFTVGYKVVDNGGLTTVVAPTTATMTSGIFYTASINVAATDNQVVFSTITNTTTGCSSTFSYTTANFITTSTNNCQSANGGGNWNNSNSWTNCGGGVPLNTDNAEITAGNAITLVNNQTIHNLTIDVNGSLTDNGNGGTPFTVTGNLTINGTISGSHPYTLTGLNKTIDGTGNFANTSTLTITGDKTIASTASLYVNTIFAINGAYTITNNGIITISGNITGTSAATVWTNADNSTLNSGGSGSSSTPPIFPTSSTGTLNASAVGNTIQFYSSSSFPIPVPTSNTYYNLIVGGSAGTRSVPAGTTIIVANDLTVNTSANGAFSCTSGRTLKVGGDWINNQGTSGFNEGTGTVIFNGSGDQNLNTSGTLFTESFYDLQVDKPGGTLYLNSNVVVLDKLTMKQGNIDAGSQQMLTLGSAGSSSSVGTLDYTSGTIIGQFERFIYDSSSPGGAVLFPIGTSSNYRPTHVTFNSVSTPGSVIAQFHSSYPGNSNLPQADADAIISHSTFRDGYWSMTAGSTTPLSVSSFDLSLTGTGFSGFPTITNTTRLLTSASTSSLSWSFNGNHVAYVSGNVVSRSLVTTFGAYAFGDPTNCTAPTLAPIFSGSEDVNPCANTTLSLYTVSSPTPSSTYTWVVVGEANHSNVGSGAVGGSDQISVNWGGSPTIGSVSVYETIATGCSGPDQKLAVNVQSIAPATPVNSSGATDVPENSDDSKPYQTYTTTAQSYYSDYQWTVTGGTIKTQTANSITVQWGSAGTGTVSVIGQTACGTSASSPVLSVNIYNLIYSTASGTWTTNATSFWSCGCVPTSSDNVFIKSGHTVGINVNTGVSVKNLLVAGTLNTGSSAAKSLTITGSLTFVNGGKIGGTISPVILSSGSSTTSTPVIDGIGSITNTQALTINYSRNILSSASVTKPVGTVALASSVTVTNNGIVTQGGDITGAGASSIWTNASGSTLNFGGTNLITGGTFNASASGNTVNYNGTAAVQNIRTPSSNQYANLSFSGSGAGIATPTTSVTLKVSENWVNNATFTSGGYTGFNPDSGTIEFNGTSTISGTATTSFNNLTITGSLTSTSGTINVGKDFTNSGTFAHGSGTVNFNGSAAQSISGNNTTFYNLTTANSGSGVTMNTAESVDNDLSITSGTLTAPSSTLTVKGNVSIAGSYVHNSGTLVFAGSSQSISGGNAVTTNFNSITINNGSTLTPPSTLNILGTLKNDGTFSSGTGTVSFCSTSSTTTAKIDGSKKITFYNINVANGSQPTDLKLITTTGAELTNILNVGSATFDADNGSTANPLTLLSSGEKPTIDASISKIITGGAVKGDVKVQRYMGQIGVLAYDYQVWRNLSAPVKSTIADLQQSIPVTGPFAGSSTVSGANYGISSMQAYDETDALGNTTASTLGDNVINYLDGWMDYPTTSNADSLYTGHGYSTFIFGPDSETNGLDSWSLTGPINSGTISLPVTYTDRLTGNSFNNGWNLIGNPYPSTIDWSASTGWTKTSIQNAIYYEDYNSANPIYATYINGKGANGGSRYIATGQGFWVHATKTKLTSPAPKLIITEDAKVAGTQTTFFREETSANTLRVTLRSSSNLRDETVIYFADSSTMEFDEQYDAVKLRNQYGFLNLSSMSPSNEKYAINGIPFSSCVGSIPLDVSDVTTGNYKLEFSEFESMPAWMTIQLKDNFKNTTTNVRVNSIYTFAVTKSNKATYGSGRFSITFNYTGGVVPLTAQNSSTCEFTSAKITIENSSPDFNYSIYSSVDNSLLVSGIPGTGTDLDLMIPSTAIANGATTFVVKESNKYCTGLDASVTASVTYVPKPTEVPSANSSTSCGQGIVMLTASGAPTDGYYNWYDSLNANTPYANQSSVFATPVLDKRKTYYVSAVNSLGCEGTRAAVEAKVVNLVPAVITVVDLFTLQSNYVSVNQWYFNGVPIPGATSQVLNPSKTGLYKLEVLSEGCTITSEKEFVVTGVDQGYFGDGIRTYPNPVNALLTIEVDDENEVTGEVYNSIGVRISSISFAASGKIQKGQYNFLKESSGLYLIKVGQGDTLKFVRVVKE